MLTGLVAYHEESAFYNTLLKEVYKGRVEMTQRQEQRGKQLLDDPNVTRRYRPLKKEAQNRSFWRTCCGRSYGLVLRQNIMKEYNSVERDGDTNADEDETSLKFLVPCCL
jgi:hypothetical protein